MEIPKNDDTHRELGYARVSSAEQNLDRQIEALKVFVVEKNIIVDKQSGKDLNRPGYQALKGPLGLREGDTLYVTSLDRLSRNKEDLKNEVRWFRDHHIRLNIIDLPTTMIKVPENQEWILDMVSNILIEVLSSLAEQERLTIRRRQREGIEAAKKKGKHLGRPKQGLPYNFAEVYRRWRAKEISSKQAMRETDLKSSSFYRAIREYEDDKSKKMKGEQ